MNYKVLALATLGIFSIVPCWAGEPSAWGQPGSIDPQLQQRLQQLKATPGLKRQNTKTPPNLPDFPKYTGRSVYVHGITMTHADGSASYSLKYECAEPPAQVADWYKKALEAGGWKLKDTSGSSITAIKNRCFCSVRAVPWPGYPNVTNMSIMYSYRR